jgi:DNA-binding response OmpR family regulator
MQNTPTILLAEDDDGHALLVQSALKKAGFHNRVVRFRDGQEALDYFFRADDARGIGISPMVLLLDIRMPKVDGVEVLRRIRERAELNTMPVIMVTTMDDPGEMTRCLELGCSFYLVKPVDWKLFNATLTGLAGFICSGNQPLPAP